MSTTSTGECVLSINSDISGVGVRVSFYLQTFLLVLLVDRSWEDAPSALWTFIATSFGLTIAAVAQAAEESLSLFQAFQVSNLVWLANFGCFLSLASYSRRKAKEKGKAKTSKPDNFVKVGAMAQTLFSMILTLYMWANASSFTYQKSCNSTVRYVLFAFDIHLKPGRIIGLVVSSVLTALYLGVTIHELRSFFRKPTKDSRTRKDEENPPLRRRHTKDTSIVIPLHSTATPETPNSALPRILDNPPAAFLTPAYTQPLDSHLTTPSNRSLPMPSHRRKSLSGQSYDSGRAVERPRRKRRPGRRQWSADLDPMLLGIATFQIVVFTYFIVSSELLIKRNRTDRSAGSWGFGQILALIVVIPSALAVVNAFKENGVGRLHRRNKKKRTRRTRRKDTESPELILQVSDVA